MEKINQPVAGREKRSIEMKGLQVFKNGRVYAVVNKYNNYSLNIKGEEPNEFVDYPHDGSWLPVRANNVPAWLKEQINEFNLV